MINVEAIQKKVAHKIVGKLSKYTRASQEELVLSLVLNTASLALVKGEYVELAPIRGTCGTFKLTGNSLPLFTYRVFEKKIMEFIEVKVEVSKPDRIHFASTIDSTTAPKEHGKEVETKDKYKEPFWALADSLYRYFPFVRKQRAHEFI